MSLAYAPPTDVRTILDENPCVGPRREGGRRFWTMRELKVLDEAYPRGGLEACMPALPGRSASSIYQRAQARGLVSPRGAASPPRNRWTTSDAIDGVIRRAYQRAPTRGDVARLAKTLGRPSWWVSKRAAALGLVAPRFKALPWSAEEIEIATERAHKSPLVIRRALAARGHVRSETAVIVQLKRLGACTEDPDHFTAGGLAKVMGVESKTVGLWIAKGLLKARRRGTDRVAAQGGDQWWISRRQVRAFIVEHVGAVDIRKCDKHWLVDLLARAA
jgi:hypothetical protein